MTVRRSRARSLALAAIASALTFAGCAARGGFVPPSGPGEPFPEFTQQFEDATKPCRDVRTLTAEASLSGRVGGQRVRGRLHIGLAEPNAVRIEGVAPFGPPAFVLAATEGEGTLLLPRDNAAVRDVPAAELVDALAGVSLSPDELRAVATGCVSPAASAVGGQRYGKDLAAITLKDESIAYLRTVAAQAGTAPAAQSSVPQPRIIAAQRKGLTIDYDDYVNGLPRRIHLRNADRADLTLTLSQVEMNVSLEPAAFTVDVPTGARALTLDELRRSGPLGKTSRD